MRFSPRPYQELIIEAICKTPRVAIWASMGMGKTVATLTALDYILSVEGGKALVIAPLRVAQSTWPVEAKKWEHLSGLKVVCVCGSAKEREAKLDESADVYCTNFENIPWLVERYGRAWPFDVIVVDEATRLKGFRLRQGSKRARALGRVAHLFCRRFVELTGTPAPNGLLDLWGQAWFLDHGERLGKSISEYQARYFRPYRVGSEAYMVEWIPNPGADGLVRDRLKDLTLTVNAEDYFPVDKPIETFLGVDLPDSVYEGYRELERDFFTELETGEAVEAVNAGVKLGKCLQYASGAIYTDEHRNWTEVHRAKMDALKSVIEEAAGAPVLVAYQYQHEAQRILLDIPNARLLDKNPQTIADWNAGKIPVLVAHPASCGHGLNLQDGGNILVFTSVGYNYETYAQIIERIGPTRQAQSGHPRPVFIYYITANHTVDSDVLHALREKEDVMNFILGKRHDLS